MGDLLHLHNEHERAQALLPWYVNGTLDAEETVEFEAHLAACAECREDLVAERAIRTAYAGTTVSGLSRPPLAQSRHAGATNPFVRRLRSGWRRTAKLALAAAAVVTLIVAVVPRETESEFSLLGSEGGRAVGNAIVLFAPETPERELRAALDQAGARLVDGPTASGAYVIHVPEQHRAKALTGLRAQPQVVLAEPVDAPSGP